MQIFSQMNCIMQASTLGSKDTLQYVSLVLNKSRTPNENFKNTLKYDAKFSTFYLYPPQHDTLKNQKVKLVTVIKGL